MRKHLPMKIMKLNLFQAHLGIGRWLAMLWLVCGVTNSLAEAIPADLIKADEERLVAMLTTDESVLNRLLSEDLHYAHSSGVVEDRQAFVNALVTRSLQYKAFEYEQRNFTLPAPGIALMKGIAKLKVSNAKGDVDLRLGYLAVWKQENGKWKFLAWQSCRLPAVELEEGTK